jgi:hypothetical protein
MIVSPRVQRLNRVRPGDRTTVRYCQALAARAVTPFSRSSRPFEGATVDRREQEPRRPVLHPQAARRRSGGPGLRGSPGDLGRADGVNRRQSREARAGGRFAGRVARGDPQAVPFEEPGRAVAPRGEAPRHKIHRSSRLGGGWVSVLVLAVAVVGCATSDPVPRTAQGYPAIRFLAPVRTFGLLTDLEIGSGTVLVADRTVGGIPYYCGSVLMRSFLMMESLPVCAVYADGVLTFSTDRVVSVRIATSSVAVPVGALEEFRLR